MRRQSNLTDIYGVKRIKTNPLEKGHEVPETGFRHSDSYHRFFRGYTEIRRAKPNGRFSIERYYTQPWIISAASTPVYWLTRLIYASLVVLSWILYVQALCQSLGSNRSWLVAIPGLPAIIALFLLSVVTVIYIFVHRKMTLWDHASSTKRLKVMSLLTGGFMGLTALMKGLFLLLYGGDIASELLCIGQTLLAAGCPTVICLIERGAVYTTVPNDTVLPEGEAHEIW